jgi:cell volume regulation protein A
VAGSALLISVVLIFVARPVAVLLSALPFRFTWKELAFISWVGLKGAVPITLATFPLMLGNPERPLQANLLFDVVFFIVVVSAVIQGTSLTPVARWLGLERPRDPEPPMTLEISSLRHVNGEIVDYSIGEDSRAAGRMVKDLALPEGAVIAMIARGEQIVPPQGNTCIHPGDHVILVLRPGIQPLVNQIFGRNSDVRGMIPSAIEFPLRATTTVRDIQELYSIQLDAPPERTLAEVIIHELGNENPTAGESVSFGALTLRVLRLSHENQIEMIEMSLRPDVEAAFREP